MNETSSDEVLSELEEALARFEESGAEPTPDMIEIFERLEALARVGASNLPAFAVSA